MTTADRALDADAAFEAQIQARIMSQLTRPIRFLLTIRMLGVLVIGLVLLAAAINYDVAWAGIALGGVSLISLLYILFKRATHQAIEFSADGLRVTFLSIVVLQSVAIAMTGGLQSPLMVVYIPSMILSAVVSGRARAIMPAMGFVVAAMGVFWAVETFYSNTLPALSPELTRILLGVIIVAACGMGATVGLVIRGAFEASVRAEAVARAGAIDMLRARNRELKELGSSLAHELKNPLSAIQGLTMQQLRNAEEGSRDAERLAVVVSEVKRLSKVLDDFLTFSRPFADVDITNADLAQSVGQVVRLYRDHLDGLGISVEITGEAHLVAPCDVRQLDHVLVNLLLNAMDVSSRGSGIEFHLGRDGERAVIELRDGGSGMTPEAMDRAFEAGFTTRDEGTGLGLAISRGIVNAHGGQLTLQNRDGGGCTARVELPMAVSP